MFSCLKGFDLILLSCSDNFGCFLNVKLRIEIKRITFLCTYKNIIRLLKSAGKLILSVLL